MSGNPVNTPAAQKALAGFEENGKPQLINLRVTGQALKGCEVQYTIKGLTNVDDLAVLDPQTMTIALFDWIYRLHGEDYDWFANSCTVAVGIVRDAAAKAYRDSNIQAIK